MNPYEIAITRCKELEQLLEQLGAHGRGLHEKISSVQHRLTSRLIGKLRFVATARNRLVHESGDWSDYEAADFTRACDWARDELQRIVSGKTAPSVERPAPSKPISPVRLLSLFGFAKSAEHPAPANPAPPVQRPAPLKSVPPPVERPASSRPARPIERPAPIQFSTPAAPAPSEPAPYSPPGHRAARGVAYADTWPSAPVRRFRSKRRPPVVLPLVLFLVAGVAISGRLSQIADAVRDFVERGIQQATESDDVSSRLATPDSRTEERLPEIFPAPTARSAGVSTRGRKNSASTRWSE